MKVKISLRNTNKTRVGLRLIGTRAAKRDSSFNSAVMAAVTSSTSSDLEKTGVPAAEGSVQVVEETPEVERVPQHGEECEERSGGPGRPKGILRTPSLVGETPPTEKRNVQKSVTFQPMFSCHACNVSSGSPHKFIDHLNAVHCKQAKVPGNEETPCSSRFAFSRHRKYCKFCDRIFYNNATLARHLEKQHSIREKDVLKHVPLTPTSVNGDDTDNQNNNQRQVANADDMLSDLEEEDGNVDEDVPINPVDNEPSLEPAMRTFKLGRTRCSICNGEFSTKYVNRHKVRVHKILSAPRRFSHKSDKTLYHLRRCKIRGKPLRESTPQPEAEAPDENQNCQESQNPAPNKPSMGTHAQGPQGKNFKMPRTKCSLCNKDIAKGYIQKHKLRVHRMISRRNKASKYGRVTCNICNFVFSVTYIKTHKLVHQAQAFGGANPQSIVESQFEISPIQSAFAPNATFPRNGMTLNKSVNNGMEEADEDFDFGSPAANLMNNSAVPAQENETAAHNFTGSSSTARGFGRMSFKLEKSSVSNASLSRVDDFVSFQCGNSPSSGNSMAVNVNANSEPSSVSSPNSDGFQPAQMKSINSSTADTPSKRNTRSSTARSGSLANSRGTP